MPSRRMLLLSDIFPPKTGGSGRWFWEIYSRLPREEFLILAGNDPRASQFDRAHHLRLHRDQLEMRTRGIKSLSNFKQYLKTAWRVRRLVKSESINCIHAARNLPEGFIAYLVRKISGTPYLVYVHGEDVGVSATSRELSWMTRRVFAKASLVIANSNNTRTMLLKEWGLSEEKVRLLYPGVDTKRFVPAAASQEVRRELGWTGRKVILTVGRLQRRKGHDHLIQALKTIRESHPEILYAILGDGDELPRLKGIVEKEDVAQHVQFLGEVADERLMQCYQQCELFALPNRQVGRDIEGFGMVLLEAQACGKPVLAGDSGGTSETMIQDETGRIVDCTSPESLAKAVIELFNDPSRLIAMGLKGREWVCQKFDWAALSREAAEVFKI